jgi:hypothetical protein
VLARTLKITPMFCRPRIRPPLFLLVATVMVVFLAACTSPRTKIAREMGILQEQWHTNLAHQAQAPERPLDWPAALELLRAHNLKLRQAQVEVTNAQESVNQVFHDLIPTLSLNASVSKTLVDLPSVSPKDVSFSASSLFDIPGLVSFGARYYMARLGKIRAEAACALTEREQIIELYKLFWAAQESQEQIGHIQHEKETAHAFEKADPFTGELMLTETEARELSAHSEAENLQERAAELLGSRQYRWVLVTNGLPQFHYDRDPLPLGDTNRVAQLQLRLAAIELEAARAELLGMKLRYWPELNIFVTGPPIYQSSYGYEAFWSANALQASANAFWWIDTRGYISRQIRQTKRQQGIEQERLRQESLGLMQKLVFTQDLLKVTRERERDLEQQLAVLEAIPPAQNFSALQKYANEYQTTSDQLHHARREAAELNTLFWFVDEAAWKDIAPLTPLADAR